VIIKKVLVAAASLAILTLGVLTSPVYAQGPQAVIKVEVQDVTDGTPFVDANGEGSALHVAPGDTLVYRITLSNTAEAAADGSNDLVDIILGMGMRTGVDPVDAPDEVANGWKVIYDDTLANIAPGGSTVKTYTAKVVSTTEGELIESAGAFNGYDRNAENNQYAYDYAYVIIDAPEPTPAPTPAPTTPTTPETPSGETTTTTTETPQTPQAPVTPAKLPNTGSSTGVAMIVAAMAALGGFAVNTLRLRRNNG